MMRPTTLILAGTATLLAISLSACRDHGSTMEEESASGSGTNGADSSNPTVEESGMNEHAPDRLSLDEAIEAARQDLARRNDSSPGEVEVLRAQTVTWANGALGCPEKGMMYTQALVEGYYIQLRSGSREHAYHAGRDGQPFLCPGSRSRTPPESGDDEPMA